jgi:hypothetical protein
LLATPTSESPTHARDRNIRLLVGGFPMSVTLDAARPRSSRPFTPFTMTESRFDSIVT